MMCGLQKSLLLTKVSANAIWRTVDCTEVRIKEVDLVMMSLVCGTWHLGRRHLGFRGPRLLLDMDTKKHQERPPLILMPFFALIQGKFYLLIEELSQLFRALVPIQLWYKYIMGEDPSSSYFLGATLIIIYSLCKVICV